MKALIVSCSRIDPGLLVIAVVVVLILVVGSFAAGAKWGAEEIDP